MRFNKHPYLDGRHATFSPSSPAWMNYDDDKLFSRLNTMRAAELGTRRHNVAAELIRLGIRQAKTASVFNRYVNDAIGWKLTPEQPLFYSENFFGTADAIGYNHRTKVLRISDYKSGVIQAKINQLEGYAALFCLEYNFKPMDLARIELRIYQEPEVLLFEGDPHKITQIMSTIQHFDRLIDEHRAEGQW